MCKYTDPLTPIHILTAEIQVSFNFGTQRSYTLEENFDWETQGSWDDFWFQGVKKPGEELQVEFYELLTRAEIDDSPTAAATFFTRASTSVETPNEA
jgi:hypothetical protein